MTRKGSAATSGGDESRPDDVLDPAMTAELAFLIDRSDPLAGQALIDVFVHDTAVRLASLRVAITDGDRQTIGAVAHSLIGSSGSFGARQLAGLCTRLEALAPSADAATLQRLIDAMHHEFDRARTALHARFGPPH